MTNVSNQAFSKDEFEGWRRALEKFGTALLTKTDVQKKLIDIKAAREFVYTDDHVAELVAKRTEKLEKLPVNVLRHKKNLTLGQIKG